MEQKEIWKHLIEYSHVYISNHGRLKTISQKKEYIHKKLYGRHIVRINGGDIHINLDTEVCNIFSKEEIVKQPIYDKYTHGDTWVNIPFNNRYMISNKGFVISLSRLVNGPTSKSGLNRTKETMLKPMLTAKGYYSYTLYNESGDRKTYPAHRLVAMTFIQNPENKKQVNHINGIKTDNRIENLEWATNRENVSHANACKFKSSKYIGVTWSKAANKWAARVSYGNKSKHLGVFINEIDAHNAYIKELHKNNVSNKYHTQTKQTLQ